MLLRLFQNQMLLQCKFIIAAANDLNTSLQSADVEATFYALQNLLNAAANVSKILGGRNVSKWAERQELKDSIGISDASPLGDVTMRNHFEHFDERLERWSRESTSHIYVDLTIGPKGRIITGVDD